MRTRQFLICFLAACLATACQDENKTPQLANPPIDPGTQQQAAQQPNEQPQDGADSPKVEAPTQQLKSLNELLFADRPALEAPKAPKKIDSILGDPPSEPFALTAFTPKVSPNQEVGRTAIRPTFLFSRPLIALGAQNPTFEGTISPEIKGHWHFLGTSTVEFVPEENFKLQASTHYTITIPSTIKDAWGTELGETTVVEFDSTHIAATYSTVEPRDYYVEDYHPHQDIDFKARINFNERPVREFLEQHLYLEGDKNEPKIPLIIDEIAQIGLKKNQTPQNDQPHYVKFHAQEKLQKGKTYTLVIDDGLQSEAGSVTANGVKYTFETYPKAQFKQAICEWSPCHYGNWSLQYTTQIAPEVLAKAITVTPEVKLQGALSEKGSDHHSTPYLKYYLSSDDFVPGMTYTFNVAEIKDIWGQTVPAHSFTLKADEIDSSKIEPSFSWKTGNLLSEANESHLLPITYRNVNKEQEFEITPLSVEEVQSKLNTGFAHIKNKKDNFATYPINLPQIQKNETGYSSFDLSRAMGDVQKYGIFQVRKNTECSSEKAALLHGPCYEIATIQVTDLGIQAKYGLENNKAFIWSLSTGKPVAGATVELWHRNDLPYYDRYTYYDDSKKKDAKFINHALATAVTDENGIATLPGAKELPKEALVGNLFIIARNGEDTAYTYDNDYPWQFGLWGRSWMNDLEELTKPNYSDYENVFFTDRSVYRPGDPVYVKGIIRHHSKGSHLEPLTGKTATVKLEFYGRGETQIQEVKLTEYGTFATSFELPKDAPLGNIELSFSIDDEQAAITAWAMARVAEFREPTLALNLSAKENKLIAGSELSAELEARNLFGSAMNGASVDYTWSWHDNRWSDDLPDSKAIHLFEEKQFAFYGNQCGSNADDDDTDDTEYEDLKTSSIKKNGVLDQNGHITLSGGESESPLCMRTYILDATVTDLDRQSQSASASYTVLPASFILAQHTVDPSNLRAGTPITTQVATFHALTGEMYAVNDIELKLQRKEVNTILRRNAFNDFERVSATELTDVGNCKVSTTTSDTPETAKSCEFTVNEAGDYYVLATGKDEKGRVVQSSQFIHVNGSDFVPVKSLPDNSLSMKLEKSSYSPGETARLLVENPFPESEAWLTVEREGVIYERRFSISNQNEPIEIPVTEEMIPNAFVSLTLVRGRIGDQVTSGDPGRPTYRTKIVNMDVQFDSRRLNVTITPDAEEKLPGSELTVNVQVKDHKNQGVESEVTLWAVHEGVLQLGEATMPKLDQLYTPRGLDVIQGNNLYGLIRQLQNGTKGGNPGGGGDEEAEMNNAASEVRKNFKVTPIFIADAKTDANGNANVKVTLPDNLTTYRLMAFAVDKTELAGGAVSKFTINKPLMANVAAPRSVRENDRFTAGVVIHSLKKEAGEVEVTAELEGDFIKPLEPLTRKINLEQGKGQEVRFAFESKDLGDIEKGEVKLRFFVKSKLGNDAVEYVLPITRLTSLDTLALYGVTEKEGKQLLSIPSNVHTERGGLDIILASTILAGLGNDATSLVNYPYNCLEQRSSRLIPLVLLQALLKSHSQTLNNDEAIQELIKENIRELAKLQRPDGSFKYWPTSYGTNFFASAWATFAVGLLQRQGYNISPINLEQAEAYLNENALFERTYSGKQIKRRSFELAIAAFALAENGHPSERLEEELAKRTDGSLFVKAMQAVIFSRQNSARKELAEKYLGEIFNKVTIEADRVVVTEDADPYGETFYSSGRTTALALLAALRTRPNHPFITRIAHSIMTSRKGKGFKTTQESAFSLLALYEYSQKFESNGGDFIASVKFGDTELTSAAFTNASTEAQKSHIAMNKLPESLERPLNFIVDGQGRLYYGARLSYSPLNPNQDAVDNGIIVQRWYTNENGDVVNTCTEGDRLRVNLRFATVKPREFVVINDPIPSGLESRDPSLKGMTTSSEEIRGAWSFDYTELHDDRVTLFTDHLQPGVYDFSYSVHATTPGSFLLAPVQAEEMYNPEVYGRSEAGFFQISSKAAH